MHALDLFAGQQSVSHGFSSDLNISTNFGLIDLNELTLSWGNLGMRASMPQVKWSLILLTGDPSLPQPGLRLTWRFRVTKVTSVRCWVLDLSFKWGNKHEDSELLRPGFLRAILLTLRLEEGGLVSAGPPCGSFVFINLHTSGRRKWRPFGFASIRKYVRDANKNLGYKLCWSWSLIEVVNLNPWVKPWKGQVTCVFSG